MKLFISLLGLGTTVGGVFIGSIQQNVLKTEKPYIDELFHEIERDIRDFSKKNPITEKDKKEIQESDDRSKRKRRDTVNNETAESQYTFSAWTNLWVGLLANYFQSLFTKIKDKNNFHLIDKNSFTKQEKEKAFQESEKINKNEKGKFEKKFKNVKDEVEKIYKKLKEFILLIEFPENYRYNFSNNGDSPYENYIKALKWN